MAFFQIMTLIRPNQHDYPVMMGDVRKSKQNGFNIYIDYLLIILVNGLVGHLIFGLKPFFLSCYTYFMPFLSSSKSGIITVGYVA